MHSGQLIKQCESRTTTPEFNETIETRLWIEEHDWLYSLLKSEDNVSPTFRFPDLISACVSLIFTSDNSSDRIFCFLGAKLVLRPSHSPRRRESMWMPQYNLLLGLQRSPANRHPNPKFQLDQLTTACVALARDADASGANVLRQARMNMASRAAHRSEGAGAELSPAHG
jgi:hypothetical protein